MTPIFKGGNKDRSKAGKCKLTIFKSITYKVLEYIILSEYITSHLDQRRMLTDVQRCKICKSRSCETQLINLLTVNDLEKFLIGCQDIDSILLDLSKAFDVVCHQKPLLKLQHYGI